MDGAPHAIPFDHKYRPKRIDDLIGQEPAIRLFEEHVGNPYAPAFLLHGPPGVGKTSWAELFGLVRNCDDRPNDPCGECTGCRHGLNPLHFYEFSGSRHDGVDVLKDVEGYLRNPPWNNFGVFIDEGHGLQPKAADVILKEIETPRPGRYFICATTELDLIRPALRSRCIIVPFRPVQPSLLFGLAQRICREEQISYEPAALEILVDLAKGSPRDLVKGLETVSRRGHLTPELLKSALSLDWTEHLVAYLDALLAGDLRRQLEAIRQW